MEGTVTKYEIHTDAKTVGEALVAVELVDGEVGDYGLFVTTVNGITADLDSEKAYWQFFIIGERSETGVDSTDIVAGDEYSMVKTISE